MDHAITVDPGKGSSRSLADRVCSIQSAPHQHDATGRGFVLACAGSAERVVLRDLWLFGFGLLQVAGIVLIIPVVLLNFLACLMALQYLTHPGIGDPQKAQTMIKVGMTKDEVRTVLGRPHSKRDLGPGVVRWEYCDDSVLCDGALQIDFGPDGRVTSSYVWWD